MSDYEIQVDRLTEKPRRYEFEATRAWWVDREPETQDDQLEVEVPFRFVLTASRLRDMVSIEGEISGRVGAECSRCARRYSHPLHEPYRLILNPVRGNLPSDPDGERGLAQNGLCLGEDLEAGFYRGPVIRLDDFMGEVIALAMPIQPLCDEACLGICAHCGLEKRNALKDEAGNPSAGCECRDEKIESPFAVLASLKQNVGGGNGA